MVEAPFIKILNSTDMTGFCYYLLAGDAAPFRDEMTQAEYKEHIQSLFEEPAYSAQVDLQIK